MKRSELLRLIHHSVVPTNVADAVQGRANLAKYGIDPAGMYQEMEMDNPYVDTHGDISGPGEAVRLHSHAFYELLYCRSGGVEYLLGADRYRLQRGDVVYIPPGVSHRPLFLEKLAEPYARDVVWVSTLYEELLSERFPRTPLLPAAPCVLRTGGTPYEGVGGLFRSGIEEEAAQNPGWEEAVCANTILLLVQLMRARTQAGTLPPPEAKRELLDALLDLIENHLAEKITLADTAHRFLVSESTIDQLFRRRMKVSFYRFVTQRRLIAAKSLLLDDVPAEETARRTGFGDYSSFYRAFRREYGISPAAFRRRQG